MNVDKFEEENNIPKGEITKVLSAQFPKFSKVQLSAVRHSEETGVTLSPKAVRLLEQTYGVESSQNKFAQLFMASGLRYADFEKAGVSRQTVHKMMCDNANPTLKTILKVCKVLGCRIEDLYGKEKT